MTARNGKHPITRPASKTLLLLVKAIADKHQMAFQQELGQVLIAASQEMAFGDGERWNLQVDRGVWVKQA